jgi:hypothetical protein
MEKDGGGGEGALREAPGEAARGRGWERQSGSGAGEQVFSTLRPQCKIVKSGGCNSRGFSDRVAVFGSAFAASYAERWQTCP